MPKDTRIDFTTTTERKNWLKATAEKQEISVSQLINRLIRNRMLQEAKHKQEEKDKKTNEFTPVPKGGFYKLPPSNINHTKTKKLGDLSKEELGEDLYNLINRTDEDDEEEEIPF